MKSAVASRLAWAIWLVVAASSVLGLVIQYTGLGEIPDSDAVPLLAAYLAFATLGAYVASRQPSNRVAWIFAAIAFAATFQLPFDSYADVLVARGLPGPLVGAVETLSGLSWASSGVLMLFVVHLFPNGRPLSKRWRPVLVLGIVGAVAGGMAVLLTPEVRVGEAMGHDLMAPNPLALPVLQPLHGLAELTAGLLGPFAALGLVSIFLRYRRSTGVERQQLKWFVFGVVVAAVGFPLLGTGISALTGRDPGAFFFLLAVCVLPLTTAVGILKYRLYDIDVVISKTVVFAGLAGFITAVYVAIVVGLGTVVGAGGEPNLGLSIVATAVVAVAFQPVRERLTRLANWLVYGWRATPYEVLSRFSAQVGETVATEQTLEHMARLLAEGTGAARAQVWLKVGEQMRSAASWPEEAVPDFATLVNADGSLPEFAEVDLAVPVSHDGQLLGALTVTKKRGEPVTPVERSLIDDLAGQAGLVLRNVRLTADLRARLEELRDSRRRLVEAQDGERRRLERDLHDGAQQQLVALKIKLNLAKRLAERDGATQAAGLVDQLVEETDEAVAALRELAHGIYPPLLAAEGLEGALRARAAKAPLPVMIEADGVGRYSQEVEAAVYFCVLEAIQNAAKYAHPSQITVRLAHNDGQLSFEVADNGIGFDPDTTPRGHGLTNMTDRLRALDGSLVLASSPGEGTSVRGSVPVSLSDPLGAPA